MLLVEYLKEKDVPIEKKLIKPMESIEYTEYVDLSHISPGNILKMRITKKAYVFTVESFRIHKSDGVSFRTDIVATFTYSLSPTSNCQLSTLGNFDQLVKFSNYFGEKERKKLFDFILVKFFKIVYAKFGLSPTKMLLIDVVKSLNIGTYLNEPFVIKQDYTNTRGTSMIIYLLKLSDQGWQYD